MRYSLEWIAGTHGTPGIAGNVTAGNVTIRERVSKEFEVQGTGAVSDDVTISTNGGILLTTSAGALNQVIIAPHTQPGFSPWAGVSWNTSRTVEWECNIITGNGATALSSIIWAGLKLTNSPTITTDDHQAFFRFETGVNLDRWQVVYSINGVDTTINTTSAVISATQYYFKIIVDTLRIARFYINGVLVHTSLPLAENISLLPFIGIQNSSGIAKTLSIFRQAISMMPE